MSIWHCDTHGLTGPMACCSQAHRATLEKADAYSGMVQDLGESRGTRPAPGNWIRYEDYMLLWNEYRALVDRGLAALAMRSQAKCEHSPTQGGGGIWECIKCGFTYSGGTDGG